MNFTARGRASTKPSDMSMFSQIGPWCSPQTMWKQVTLSFTLFHRTDDNVIGDNHRALAVLLSDPSHWCRDLWVQIHETESFILHYPVAIQTRIPTPSGPSFLRETLPGSGRVPSGSVFYLLLKISFKIADLLLNLVFLLQNTLKSRISFSFPAKISKKYPKNLDKYLLKKTLPSGSRVARSALRIRGSSWWTRPPWGWGTGWTSMYCWTAGNGVSNWNRLYRLLLPSSYAYDDGEGTTSSLRETALPREARKFGGHQSSLSGEAVQASESARSAEKEAPPQAENFQNLTLWNAQFPLQKCIWTSQILKKIRLRRAIFMLHLVYKNTAEMAISKNFRLRRAVLSIVRLYNVM